MAPAGTASAVRPPPRRSMTVPAGPNGHFALDAKVNGKTVRFMVDTGATGIVLNREDAERVGLRPRARDFSQVASSANGVVRWAPVVLRDVRVGSLSLRQVEASVNGGRLDVSLLGMSFLRRLNGYEVRNDSLVLYW
jgi:aspartyl protease family protein